MQISKIFAKDGQKNCEFVLGAHNASQFPVSNLKEFAFIGASNVGKSSLVNAITSQKIAITSNTPGRTRQVNFFCLAKKIMIVDMPGYGFAKARDKHIEQWQKTSFEYFAKRSQLKRIFLLIDPIKSLKESDLEMINIFNGLGISFQIILTKSDKIKFEEIAKVKQIIVEKSKFWPAFFNEIIIASSKTNQGIEDIKKSIVELTLS